MLKKLILILIYSSIVSGCISNRVVVPEVQTVNGKATLIGSKTMHKGAQVIAHVTEIDGRSIQGKPKYSNPLILEPGTHHITVKSVQCRSAQHTFEVNLEPNIIYVAQATTVDYDTHELWISNRFTGELVVEKVHAEKGGPCAVVIPI